MIVCLINFVFAICHKNELSKELLLVSQNMANLELTWYYIHGTQSYCEEITNDEIESEIRLLDQLINVVNFIMKSIDPIATATEIGKSKGHEHEIYYSIG
jgi:hypothetical protein